MEPKKSLCFALALFFLSSCMLFSEGLDNAHPVPYFSLLAFTYQWPPSVCSNLTVPSSCASGDDQNFTLSRFTPMPRPAFQYPCRGLPFDIKKIEDIKPELIKYWYDFVEGKNENMWEDAWEIDGRCSVFNQTDYFQLALNLRNNRDYLHIVQTVGMLQNDSYPLPYNRFYNALYWRLGKRPALECNINQHTHKDQIKSVTLCFEYNGIDLIDCPIAKTCPDSFIWPTTPNFPSPPNSLSIDDQ